MKLLFSETRGTHIAIVKDTAEASAVEAGDHIMYTEFEAKMLEGRDPRLIKAVHEVKAIFGGFIEEITEAEKEVPRAIALLLAKDFADYPMLQAELDKFPPFVLITEASRYSYMALRYAHERSYAVKVCKDSRSGGRSAKAIEKAIAESDRLVIFCGNTSPIPERVTDFAKSKNIPVQIVRS